MFRFLQILSLLIVIVVTGAVVSGCGGGDDASNEGASITKAAFVKQANAICRKDRKQIQAEGKAIFQELRDAGETESFGESFARDVLVPGFEAEVEEIRDLGVPPGDQAQVDAILSAIQRAVASPAKITETLYPFARPEKLAKAYGVGECGAP